MSPADETPARELVWVPKAATIAREAGARLREFYAHGVETEYKGDVDLVTVADRAVEKLIRARLGEAFPGHGIFGEEGTRERLEAEFRWYVDPLDGTTNFAHGFPAFNVTLGLERAGELIAGVIFDPLRNEMFMAERGGGAWLLKGSRKSRLQVSGVLRLEDALVATGFPSRKRHQDVNVHFYYQLAMLTHGVRRAGSAALDLAYVACGRLDMFWEFGLNPWDMAAGILLIEEAGGRVTDMRGGPHTLRSPHLLSDNGAVHAETLALFEEIFAGRVRYRMPGLTGS